MLAQVLVSLFEFFDFLLLLSNDEVLVCTSVRRVGEAQQVFHLVFQFAFLYLCLSKFVSKFPNLFLQEYIFEFHFKY